MHSSKVTFLMGIFLGVAFLQPLQGQENYRDLIISQEPSIYYRLGEMSGGVAENLGTAGALGNGFYGSDIQLNQPRWLSLQQIPQ